MQLLSQNVNIEKLHTALLLQYKLEATITAHSRRPHSNHHKQLHLNLEVTVTQVQETRATPHGRIIANRRHSWFTSSKWASQSKTVSNQPAITVFWCGNKQWKVCVQHHKTQKQFYDGVGVVLCSGYVNQKQINKPHTRIIHDYTVPEWMPYTSLMAPSLLMYS
jgi:hypothetical protein